MSLSRKAALAALSSMLVIAGTAIAQNAANKSSALKYGFSGNLTDQYTPAFGVGVDLRNSYVEAGLGVSFARVDDGSERYTRYNLTGYLGFRTELHQKLYGAIGLMAAYGMNHNFEASYNRAPYNVGPYLGLSYSPIKSTEFFFRILPIAYGRDVDNSTSTAVFEEGQVGVAYFF